MSSFTRALSDPAQCQDDTFHHKYKEFYFAAVLLCGFQLLFDLIIGASGYSFEFLLVVLNCHDVQLAQRFGS